MIPFRRFLAASALAAACLAFLPQPATARAPLAAYAPAADLIDINTADPGTLSKNLPGIGDAYAKRIVAGRPYTAKNQLVTRGIIPQGTYDKIKDMIIARAPAKK